MAINIIDINVKSLIPNPNNPRKDVGDVTELADSIKEQGLQQRSWSPPTTRNTASACFVW